MFSCAGNRSSLIYGYSKNLFRESEWRAALQFDFLFFFSFERVTTEMDFGRSKTDWKHFGVISERESEGMFSFVLLSFQRLAEKSIQPWLSHYYFSFLFYTNWIFAPRIVLFVARNDFLKLKPKVPLCVDVSPTEDVGTFRWMSEAKCIKTYLVDVSKCFLTRGNSRVSSKQLSEGFN